MINTLVRWHNRKSLKDLLHGINIAGIFRNSEIDRKNERLTTFIKWRKND